MLKRLTVVAVAAALLIGTAIVPSQAARYRPPAGPMFNNPYGRVSSRAAILDHIRSAVNHTPKGATIRLATYSFNRPSMANALIAAHHRGVNVQMVINDNVVAKPTKRLQSRLGSNIHKKSFVKICARSCRGGWGNQHAKFYLFSRSGTAKNVIMVGSANLTGYGAHAQWNDLYTFDNRGDMMPAYVKIFGQMAQDKNLAHPWYVSTEHGIVSQFSPHPNTTTKNDPIMRRLRAVSCKAKRGYGSGGHTVIRVAMYGWVGARGVYLATKMASLAKGGCRVSVILSHAGRKIVGILKRGGVHARSADFGIRKDCSYRKYTHEKWMALSGTYAGKGFAGVWTGSQNWSPLADHNDEVTVQIPRYFHAYSHHFDFEWTHHTHAFTGTTTYCTTGAEG
ncbi:MAG: phospholipase D-like domain-containing protein [Nocardioidaceae bacterium]